MSFYRGSKYGNVPNRCSQGVMHQSKLESRRCDELHMLEAGGLITDLQAHPQPSWRLDVAGEHISTYRADFTYLRDGQLVVEDTKGRATEVYRLKAKLMKACHGIVVSEVRKARGAV